MWFADKLGPSPKNTPQARADGPGRAAAVAKADAPAKGGKAAPPPSRAAAAPQAARPAPEPEAPKKKKGWF